MTKKKPETAKVDPYLLGNIKKFLTVRENKIKYPNTKHFINIAVLKLLEEEGIKNG